MSLWFILALMTLAAVFAVLWPLGRRPAAGAGASDLAVYRDQLAELERPGAAAFNSEPDLQAARTEIGRRLLAAADAQASRPPPPASPRRRRVAAGVALVLLPVGALALYIHLGNPLLPDAPLASRTATPLANRPLESLVAQVEAHLETKPDDGRGWEVIAPVYLRLGRYEDAVRARRNALRLNGPSPQRESDLGEALVFAANGVVTAEAKEVFERALALDAKEPKARYFIALAAEQDGDREKAAALYRALLADATPDAPWADLVRRALARVNAPAVAVEPTPDQVAAAEDMTPEARQAMIRGMVERLATRLAADGSDIEGWLQLLRAYMVLGEPDKAKSAVADARRALAQDAEKLRRVNDLAKSLGLDA